MMMRIKFKLRLFSWTRFGAGRSLAWLLALGACLITASADAQALYDGPYVLYTKDSVLVKTVEAGRAVQQRFPLKAAVGLPIPVKFEGHEDWNFTVELRGNPKVEPAETAQPEKLFFVSDVEGEFDGFRRLLVAGEVINEKYEWTFGKGHVVLCGDLFDRGEQVPETIWLIYKLEGLARAAGGEVHTILGNHDIMNLSGDLRYVQPKYFESARLMGVDYLSLFGRDSEIGRWLRAKNVIERIGDNICTHAGIAPQINKLGLSLSEINEGCRPYYDKASAEVKAAGESVSVFFSGETSPFWYRGYFFEPKATEAEVEETLRVFGAKRIVVGHTIVPGNVGFQYGGKVLGLDVNAHQGDHQAALFDGGKWFKLDDKGLKTELVN